MTIKFHSDEIEEIPGGFVLNRQRIVRIRPIICMVPYNINIKKDDPDER